MSVHPRHHAGAPARRGDGGHAGNASAGKSSGKAGANSGSDGGRDTLGDGGEPTAGSTSGGKNTGGRPVVGDPEQAGGGDGGANGEPITAPPDPFPDGACRDCMARDCPSERSSCVADSACREGAAEWLACTADDANACVTSEPGLLQQVEACGALSCDVCRHLSDGAPSVEILTPSSGAAVQLNAAGGFQISVRVHNIRLAELGSCGTDTNCGHLHLNLDGPNCYHNSPFYNEWVVVADANGYGEAVIDTTACMDSISGRPLVLSASLSNYNTHSDRVPLVQSSVTVTIDE